MNAKASRREVIFKTFIGKVKKAVVTEGVFDAIKVGRIIPSIALLGKEMTLGQLKKIIQSTERAIVILDNDAWAWQIKIISELCNYIPTKGIFLRGEKDLGDMEEEEIEKLLTRGGVI